MARKKIPEDYEHVDRWMVSYADFITLLFAFFVVMYAVSTVDNAKFRVLSDSMDDAFRRPVTPMRSTASPVTAETPDAEPVLPPNPKKDVMERKRLAAIRAERDQLTSVADNLQKVLGKLVDQGKVKVSQTSRGVTVEINASVLFAPGDARLSTESAQALTAVASVLKDDGHALQVEGHTDNVPISSALFPSNWELSAVRASSVVRLFIDDGIAASRLVAVGYGSNLPVASNDTPEGRLANRRVQLTILSGVPEVKTDVPVGRADVQAPMPQLPALPAVPAVTPIVPAR
ncbi:MAG: flagellar motor protein MotD [Janthinobacterium lividum]